jgi:hypothetical protein
MNFCSAPRYHVIGLIALCGLLFFSSLARIPFFNKGEPREALVVQDIVQQGSWVFPLKGGEAIPSKPPLFHWFGALASLAWGRVTEATVRFPSALFATLGVLVMYALGRRLFDSQAAFWGGVILATSVGYQSEAISARVDMTLSFFVTLSLAAFYLLYRGILRGELWWHAWYLLLGAGVLAKGPVGLALPAMIIGCFLALNREWEFLRRLCFHKGALLALAVPLLWYSVALVKGGEDFFARQILHENLARFFAHGEAGTGHQKPFYYYLPYLILEGLPWSLFLPFVIYWGFKRGSLSRDHLLFLGLWASVIFVFFSLSAGKRSVYLLPLYPPFSLLAAVWFLRGGDPRDRALGLRLVGAFSVIVGLALLLVAWAIMEPGWPRWGFAALARFLRPKDQFQLAAVQQALGQAGKGAAAALLLFAGLWCATAVPLLAARARSGAAGLAILSMVASLLAQRAVVPSIAEAKTYKSFVQEVNRRVARDAPLVIYAEGWDYASVLFYRGSPIPVVRGDALALRKRLLESQGYGIMSLAAWRKIAASGALPFQVLLTSGGPGPDGDGPIVLVRGG